MNRDFDIFVKEHLDDIFCQVEKERALKKLHIGPYAGHKAESHTPHHHRHSVHEIYLQECAIETSFSHNHA